MQKENFNFELKQKQSSRRFLGYHPPCHPSCRAPKTLVTFISHSCPTELHFVFHFVFITHLWNVLGRCENMRFYNALCRELSVTWAKQAPAWDYSHLTTATTNRQNDTHSTPVQARKKISFIMQILPRCHLGIDLAAGYYYSVTWHLFYPHTL